MVHVVLVLFFSLFTISAGAQTTQEQRALRSLNGQLEDVGEQIYKLSREFNRFVYQKNSRIVMEDCVMLIGRNRYVLATLDLSEFDGLTPVLQSRIVELQKVCKKQEQLLKQMATISTELAQIGRPGQVCGPAQVAQAALMVLQRPTSAQLIFDVIDEYQSTTQLRGLLREYKKNYDLFKNPDQMVDEALYSRWNQQFFALLRVNPSVVKNIPLDDFLDIAYQGKVTFAGEPEQDKALSSFFVQNYLTIFARLNQEDVLQGARMVTLLKRIFASNAPDYKTLILQELFDFMRTENDLIWLSRIKDDSLKARALSLSSPSETLLTEVKNQIASSDEIERNVFLRMKILIHAFKESALITDIDQELMARIQQNIDRKNDFSYKGLRHSKIGDVVKGLIKYENKLSEMAKTQSSIAATWQRHQNALNFMGHRTRTLVFSDDQENDNWHALREDFMQTLVDLDSRQTLFDDLVATSVTPAPVP